MLGYAVSRPSAVYNLTLFFLLLLVGTIDWAAHAQFPGSLAACVIVKYIMCLNLIFIN